TRASETTVVPFTAARPDIPRPIRYWYLPGPDRGFEFVYPRVQAVAIAATTGERVLTAETTTTASMRTVQVMAVDGDGRRVSTADRQRALDVPRVALNTTPELPPRTTPALVEEPAGARRPEVPPRAAAVQETPAPPAPPPPAQAAPMLDELPGTAGTTAAILLLGVVCLIVALALRLRRRHVDRKSAA